MAIATFQTNAQAVEALENGNVVFFPDLPFKLQDHELVFLNPQICDGKRKNVSFDLSHSKMSGVSKHTAQDPMLKALMRRYAEHSRQLLRDIFPSYDPHVIHARTSYRPVEIAGRVAPSFRKDDTRLHIDAFPATPTQGKRILRMFTNVNPQGQARVWRTGEELPAVISKFAPTVQRPVFGSRKLQSLLRITRGYRTLYDHFMLNIHDNMKEDVHYQQHVANTEVKFPPGSTWFVYTDQVSHAAMAGQYVFEQTFYLPVSGMQDQSTSPLRVLENFLHRKLL